MAALMPGCAAGTYRNTGTYGTPVWSEQTSLRDVKPKYGWSFAEAVSRAQPMKLYAKAVIDLPVQAVMRADPVLIDYQAWVDAAQSRTAVLDLLILNGKVTLEGARGVRGEWLLSIEDEPQEIEGMIYSTFELRPTLTANGVPKWVIVAVGPVVSFTAMTF